MSVRLTEQSDDRPRTVELSDLPLDVDLRLEQRFEDVSVLASLDNPDNPIFHVPLRTALQVGYRSDRYIHRSLFNGTPSSNCAMRCDSWTPVCLDNSVQFYHVDPITVTLSRYFYLYFFKPNCEANLQHDINSQNHRYTLFAVVTAKA